MSTFTFVSAPTPTVIEYFGFTSLTQVGDTYFLDAIGTNIGPQLSYQGSPVTSGLYAGWTLFGAEQVAGGYQVAWKNVGTGQFSVWNVDSNGNFINNPIGIVSASDSGLKTLENSFHQDLNGDGTTGVPTVILESFGSTSLAQAGDTYFLYANGTTNGPQLKYQGSPVTSSLYPGWSMIGAEQVSGGYQVAWKNVGTGQFSVWNVDSNGNFINNPIGIVSASDSGLKTLENSFHQDLNGDGTTGVPTVILESFGSTSLAQAGDTYFLYANGTTNGPQLKYQGSPVTSSLYPGWSMIGAEQVSGGYQVAWKNVGTGQFSVWNVDSNGNFINNPIGIVSASDSGLKTLENSFHQDLNGDSTIGAAAQGYSGAGVVTFVYLSSATVLIAPATLILPATLVIAPASDSAILSGSAANDTFVFGAQFGNDTIVDFQPGSDSVRIDHTLFASVSDLFSHTADDADGNAVITVASDQSIKFQGVPTAVIEQHLHDFYLA